MAELNFKVKSYDRQVNYIKVHKPTTTITLYFNEWKKVGNDLLDGKEVPFIIIEFEHPIEPFKPAIQTAYGIGDWGNNEIAYYGGRTVKEISGLRRMKK